MRALLGFSGLLVLTWLGTAGCGMSMDEGGMGEGSASGAGSGGSVAPPGAGGSSAGVEPGQLTAADWDDNLNFEIFQAYRGALAPGRPTIESADRRIITVVDAHGLPVSNARVSVHDGMTSYLDAPTATDGRLLFFPLEDGAQASGALSVTITPPLDQVGVSPITVAAPAGVDWTIELPGAEPLLPEALDLAFVIDTTGSMGDEIEYLKIEVQSIVDATTQAFGPISLRFGLVAYRDIGDSYVTQTIDFTTNVEDFEATLASKYAGGGGDLPEAIDQAIGAMSTLTWRDGNVARMAFLIADAPPHAEDGAAFLAGADAARHRGIKVYPVGASGVDGEAEYYLRLAAEATLARYLFLTDDSGIGDDHAEPHIPCYQVQHLNVLMTRMIASELTGTRMPADPEDVVRTVGFPMGNVCALRNGGSASF